MINPVFKPSHSRKLTNQLEDEDNKKSELGIEKLNLNSGRTDDDKNNELSPTQFKHLEIKESRDVKRIRQ